MPRGGVGGKGYQGQSQGIKRQEIFIVLFCFKVGLPQYFLAVCLITLIEGGWWGKSWLNTPYCCTNWVRFTSCAFPVNIHETTSSVARLQNYRRPPPCRHYLCSSNQHLFPTHFKFCCDRKRAIAGDSAAYWIGKPPLGCKHQTTFP